MSNSIQQQDTIQCEHCGTEMWDDSEQEMELHQAECEGFVDPVRRFNRGDRVETSDFGVERLGRGRRHGEIVGFGKESNAHCVRVQWDELETPKRLAHLFIRPEGYGENWYPKNNE